MPTGKGTGHFDGRYRAPMGAGRYMGKSIKSFSLDQSNVMYLEGVVKGHRSDVVNRALDLYRRNGYKFENLEAARDQLQKLVLEYSKRIEELEHMLSIPRTDHKTDEKRKGAISNFFYKVKRHFWR